MVEDISQIDSSPTLLRALTEEQQVRLTEILDEYLSQLEQQNAPSKERLIAAYPELGDALRLYLEKLEDLHLLTDGRDSLGCDLTGKVLGDYVLEEEIGRGGMGIVFAARQSSLERRVAIKLLPMAAMLEPKFIERFRNEARAAAALQHPNIVPVHSVGEDAGIHYYAMRLISGCSLDERIAVHNHNDTHPPTTSALKQFANVADAMHAAHQFGIVHRDIKPSNLLLDDDGKLWVADFGLARFQEENALTRTGEMVGTMRYMSPEQANGRAEMVDHRTDIYSLGATVYEMLTGRQAVQGEDGPGLLRTITTQSPPRVRKLRPELPRDLQTVIEKAMARHRDDRYETAKDLADDLRRVADGVPISTKLVSSVVLVGRWAGNNPALFSFALVFVITVALGLSTATYMVNKIIAHERDQAQENLRKAMATEEERSATIDRMAFMPGVEELRKSLIPISLRYYQEFVAQDYRNPKLRVELAKAYSRMGALTEEIGEPVKAVTYFQTADEIFRKLIEENEESGAFVMNRLENLNHLAMAMSNVGSLPAAIGILEEGVRIGREVKSTASHETEIEYGLTENNFGLLLQKNGELAKARDAFGKAIETLERMQKLSPENLKASRSLGAAFHNLGATYADSENLEERELAIEFFEAALRLQLAIGQQSHNRLRASIDLVATYLSIGNLKLSEEKSEAAILAFDRAVQLARKLVDISPQVDSYRRDLAVGLGKLGMSSYQAGESERAQESLRESVHEYRNLLTKHPKNIGLQSSLGITLNNQGIVLQHLGESRRAEDAYIRAESLLETIEPLQTEALNMVYVNHVRMLKDAGRESEAEEVLRRQLALFSSEEGKL